MDNVTKKWESRIIEVIRGVAGTKAINALEVQWRDHAAITVPVVTLFGSYDSGKSTLLKRLLVDAGVAVPEWLTIAARRDTFEVNEVDVSGCRFRDTPGISSGNPDHERAAREALTTTDVILLVMPPQLITGDREAILAVVGGEIFRAGGLRLTEEMALVMCKMDEGGYDPCDDPAAYAQYIMDKRRELLAILERNNVEADADKIFGVAADPNQTVVNARNPGRVAYDGFREWDGLVALQEWLKSLPDSLKTLRALCRKRFLCAAAEAHRDALRRRVEDVQLALKETKSNQERFALLNQQLDALLKQARSALDAVIEDELLTAARARLDDESAISDFVQPRLEKAVARWWDDQTAGLENLITIADAEVAARSTSRGEETARRVFGKGDEDEQPRRQATKKVVVSLVEKARIAIRDHHEQSLGMKLEKAREELRKLDDAKTFGDYLAGAGRRKSFRTLAEAERARKVVTFHTVVGTAGPLVMELGMLLWDEKQRQDLERQRVERRQKVRDMIRNVARDIGQKAWQAWELQANEFMAWLSQNGKAADAMAEPLQEELQTIGASQHDLEQLLAEAGGRTRNN